MTQDLPQILAELDAKVADVCYKRRLVEGFNPDAHYPIDYEPQAEEAFRAVGEYVTTNWPALRDEIVRLRQVEERKLQDFDFDTAVIILTDVCQLFDGWHSDLAWSRWDEAVRGRVSGLLGMCIAKGSNPLKVNR